MAQYALDRVLSVAGTYAAANAAENIKEGDLAFFADQITDPSLSFTSETEDVVDASNNVVMVLENGRGATFSAANAFFNTQILAQQVGGEVTVKDDATVTKYEVVSLTEGDGTIQGTPATDTTVKIFVLNKDNSLIEASPLTVTTDYTLDGKTLTVSKTHTVGDEAVKYDKVLAVYEAEVKGEEIKALANAKNKLLNVTAEVLLRDLCDESLVYAYIVLRGKLSGEAEWSMTRDGNHAFEFRCMPDYCSADRELVKVIVVND